MNDRPPMTASAMVSWRPRSTPGQPISVLGKFRRFCSPGITQRSQNGVKSRQPSAPVRIGRIYSDNLPACHPERSEAQSKDLAKLPKTRRYDSSISLEVTQLSGCSIAKASHDDARVDAAEAA